MSKIIGFIVSYWAYAVIAALTLMWGVQTYRLNSLKADIAKTQLEQVKHDVQTLVKRNDIASHRPSDKQLIERLSAGSF